MGNSLSPSLDKGGNLSYPEFEILANSKIFDKLPNHFDKLYFDKEKDTKRTFDTRFDKLFDKFITDMLRK